MRTFELFRAVDETGISGRGTVAEGVTFGDGSCVLRWTAVVRSTVFYDSIEDVELIHGHAGKTQIVWRSDVFDRGRLDAVQDSCENAPFASVGGIKMRLSMALPKYIAATDGVEYIRGYRHGCRQAFGEDWETCELVWAPAMRIEASP